MANVKRGRAKDNARVESIEARTPPLKVARPVRVQRCLDWIAGVGATMASLADGEEKSLSTNQAEMILDEYVAVIEHAQSVVRGTADRSTRIVLVVETMLRYAVGDEQILGRKSWVSWVEPAVMLDMRRAAVAREWDSQADTERMSASMAEVAGQWDPSGLGVVSEREWGVLLENYKAAPLPVRKRGVRKRGVRDRDDVVFEFLREHDLTRATTAKNLRDAADSAVRAIGKQTR